MTRISTTVVKWTARLEQLQFDVCSAVVAAAVASVAAAELVRETLLCEAAVLCELALDLDSISALFPRLHIIGLIDWSIDWFIHLFAHSVTRSFAVLLHSFTCSLFFLSFILSNTVVRKKCQLTFVHIFAKYWPILKFFHVRTLRRICNKAITKLSTTP